MFVYCKGALTGDPYTEGDYVYCPAGKLPSDIQATRLLGPECVDSGPEIELLHIITFVRWFTVHEEKSFPGVSNPSHMVLTSMKALSLDPISDQCNEVNDRRLQIPQPARCRIILHVSASFVGQD